MHGPYAVARIHKLLPISFVVQDQKADKTTVMASCCLRYYHVSNIYKSNYIFCQKDTFKEAHNRDVYPQVKSGSGLGYFWLIDYSILIR